MGEANEVGHVMGIQTVAEYLETPDIFKSRNRNGTDFAQGICISKPKPIASGGLQTSLSRGQHVAHA